MAWNPFAPAPQQQQAPAPAQAATGNAPTPQAQPGFQTPANPDPFNPTPTQNPQQTAEPVSPLDQFKDLFQTNATAEAQVDPLTAPFWDYDPTKVREHVATLNFMPTG